MDEIVDFIIGAPGLILVRLKISSLVDLLVNIITFKFFTYFFAKLGPIMLII